MQLTREQIESFHQFALEKLDNGGAESLEECLRLWHEETERGETIAAVKRGEADLEAGRRYTLEEADAEIRRRFDSLK